MTNNSVNQNESEKQWETASHQDLVEIIKKHIELSLSNGGEPKDIGSKVWSSFANVTWYNVTTFEQCSFSFRGAGGLIADAFEAGNYIDWYCSGPYAEVCPVFAKVMKKEGWISDETPDVCDEPDCYNSASSGYPAICGNYRYSCGTHYRKYSVRQALHTEGT